MNALLKSTLAVAGLALAAQASAQITFYENDGFSGRSFTASRQMPNFERSGFNDRASSVVVMSERWEVCDDAQYAGRCVVLRPGRYGSLSEMGLNDRVSSVRPVGRNTRVDDNRFAPVAAPVYDNRRRNNERLFEADVTSVRAVVGQSGQRCWIEREQVGGSSNTNVPGAILGAVIGGVLGHQIGGGRGQDIATAGGAVAGAAYGANSGGGSSGYSRDVQRCTDVSNRGQPTYWDVTYNFRGQEHSMQMLSPPGRTVTVNARGEPRS
jgi:uncharacterized protein YcfJ